MATGTTLATPPWIASHPAHVSLHSVAPVVPHGGTAHVRHSATIIVDSDRAFRTRLILWRVAFTVLAACIPLWGFLSAGYDKEVGETVLYAAGSLLVFVLLLPTLAVALQPAPKLSKAVLSALSKKVRSAKQSAD